MAFFPAEFGHDCLDLLYKGYTQNGFYYIYPDGASFIKAFCDQETNGGGWTFRVLIHARRGTQVHGGTDHVI